MIIVLSYFTIWWTKRIFHLLSFTFFLCASESKYLWIFSDYLYQLFCEFSPALFLGVKLSAFLLICRSFLCTHHILTACFSFTLQYFPPHILLAYWLFRVIFAIKSVYFLLSQICLLIACEFPAWIRKVFLAPSI